MPKPPPPEGPDLFGWEPPKRPRKRKAAAAKKKPPKIPKLLPPSVPVDSSEDAARSMIEHAARLRRIVYDAHVAAPDGCTCDELEVKLLQKHQTVSARIKELLDLNLLYDTGDRRKTRTGRPARVCKALKLREMT